MKKKGIIAIIIIAVVLILLALLAILLFNNPGANAEPTTLPTAVVENFGQVDWDLP